MHVEVVSIVPPATKQVRDGIMFLHHAITGQLLAALPPQGTTVGAHLLFSRHAEALHRLDRHLLQLQSEVQQQLTLLWCRRRERRMPAIAEANGLLLAGAIRHGGSEAL